MQFTQKSKEHIDSCRFCWMCHHVCPIGNATGLERNTARARAMGLSLVMRDAIEYSDDIINNVYECSLCGGCMTDCVTGWDPVMFTREARLGAALDGKLPEYIMDMIQKLQRIFIQHFFQKQPLQHLPKSMKQSPDKERKISSMPDSRQKKHNKQVHISTGCSLPVAAPSGI